VVSTPRLERSEPAAALGNNLARRYPPVISPMAAVRDVFELLAPGDAVGLFSVQPVEAGGYLDVVAQKVVDQMVYDRGQAAPISGEFI
jgi:hypothetical protein